MNEQQAQARIAELTQQLEEHNYRYYVLAQPTATDSQFDALLRELQALEAQFPHLASPQSPTQRVGGQVTKDFPAVTHRRPMMSLANAYSPQDLADWHERVCKGLGTSQAAYLAQLKIDGVALSLTYHHGLLVRGVTRGDGTQGDDITPNVKTLRGLPLRLRGQGLPAEMEVRGEVYMTRSDFDALNRQRELDGEPPLMNPRNTTAGALKLQDSAEVARRPMRFWAWQLFIDDPAFPQPDTDEQSQHLMAQWGLPVMPQTRVLASLPEVQQYLDHWAEARHELPFDTDGVVLKLNALAPRAELGATGKAPRWAVAYKFAAEQAQTTLLQVEFSVGRTGHVTPVANLQPVLLAGTTVKRASLYNFDEIERLGLRLGCTVVVEKAGEIIPKVMATVPQPTDASLPPVVTPTTCPACGTPLVREPGEVGYYCPNAETCPPQVTGRLEHYVQRRALDVQGLGEEMIALLVRQGLVRTPADLYDLTVPQLAGLERLGQKSAENIVAGIAASRQVPYARVLYGLGIRYVGEGVAQKLARRFTRLDDLLAADLATLEATPEVGPRIAASIRAWAQQPQNLHEVARLRAAGLQLQGTAPAQASARLAGKKVLFSGSFEGYSRDDLKALAQSHGAELASGVTQKLDYLVAGTDMGPAKLQKAHDLGLKIWTLEEFLGIIEP